HYAHIILTLSVFIPPRPPRFTLFPYTTLFRSRRRLEQEMPERLRMRMWGYPWLTRLAIVAMLAIVAAMSVIPEQRASLVFGHDRDRKSTRLNSSHLGISYAVFCLKKKNKNTSY